MSEKTVPTARRMSLIPPYLFAEIDRKVRAKKAAGIDVISLGIGDPDLPTPPRIVSALQEAAADPANHQYPSYFGLAELRSAIADWYSGRFGATLDPETEILAPDPGYTPYATGAIMADGEPYMLPLTAANGWLPDLAAIPADVRRRAKLLWLNYPNNPTATVAPDEFFKQAIEFCEANGIILCHDAPYTEIAFGGYRPHSLLQFPGGKEVGLEFHSASKTYNMTGWRIGWIAGNASLIKTLGQLKTNVDSGIFQAVQWAAIEALRGGEGDTRAANEVYYQRHVRVASVFNGLGWNVTPPKATFYVWAPVPKGYDSISFASHVLDQVGVNITPGVGFGRHGEGYFRLSVTAPDRRLDEALERLKGLEV